MNAQTGKTTTIRLPIRVPPLGGSIDEAEFVGWEKRIGDSLAANDVVAEVETEKCLIRVATVVPGRLVEQCIQEGWVRVGEIIGTMAVTREVLGPRTNREVTLGHL